MRFLPVFFLAVVLVGAGCQMTATPWGSGPEPDAESYEYSRPRVQPAEPAHTRGPIPRKERAEPAGAPAGSETPIQVTQQPPKHTRHVHRQLAERTERVNFLDLLYRQGQVREELGTLGRLAEEKNLQYERAQQTLAERFGIDPDIQYVYDPDRRVILAIDGEAGEQNVHRRLHADENVQAFLRLVEARRLIQDTLRSLQNMIARKQTALQGIEAELRDGFEVHADRVYQYDPATATVYEVVAAQEPKNQE